MSEKLDCNHNPEAVSFNKDEPPIKPGTNIIA